MPTQRPRITKAIVRTRTLKFLAALPRANSKLTGILNVAIYLAQLQRKVLPQRSIPGS
jgi:hypothetical protein